MADSKAYKNVFKTTFLFGFVQIFNIIVKVGINKVVALLLGAEGIGVISLFNTTINLIKTGAGLGVNQSAVRDISEAYGSNDEKCCSDTIALVNKVIKYTCLFGIVVMIIFSPVLSNFSFGNSDYIISYIFLSIVVAAAILNDGQKAILTGMRQLRSLAKASMLGAVTGLFSALPFYYFLGQAGIVPSLIVSAISTLLVSYYFVNKIKYERIRLSVKEAFKKSSLMIKMGVSLMLLSFMVDLSNLIVSSFISNHGGLIALGYYQSGITIISGYFGVIITAMSTDYYPRISAINKDNTKLNDAVNAQSEVGMLLALPLVVTFLFLSPFFLSFLYSSEFVVATQYVDFAILGTVLIICSNSMGMILLAKQEAKIFLLSSFITNTVVLLLYIWLYELYSLKGLGIGYFLSGLIQFVVFNHLMKAKYGICFNRTVICRLCIVLVFAIAAQYAKEINFLWLRYITGCTLLTLSVWYTLYYMNKNMGINILVIMKTQIKKHV